MGGVEQTDVAEWGGVGGGAQLSGVGWGGAHS